MITSDIDLQEKRLKIAARLIGVDKSEAKEIGKFVETLCKTIF